MKTKKISSIFIPVLLFAGISNACCQSSKIIDDHFSALSKHDVPSIAAGYSDSAKLYSPNWEGAQTGHDSIAKVYTRYFSSTPDLSYKVNHIINADDHVVVEYTVNGTLSNPEGATPAYMKDKKYTLNYCAIFYVQNNKIIRETDYFDQVAFLRQVGFFDQH